MAVNASRSIELNLVSDGAQNKRLERTRHERASLLSNLGEPLKRSVRWPESRKRFNDDETRVVLNHLLRFTRVVVWTQGSGAS